MGLTVKDAILAGIVFCIGILGIAIVGKVPCIYKHGDTSIGSCENPTSSLSPSPRLNPIQPITPTPFPPDTQQDPLGFNVSSTINSRFHVLNLDKICQTEGNFITSYSFTIPYGQNANNRILSIGVIHFYDTAKGCSQGTISGKFKDYSKLIGSIASEGWTCSGTVAFSKEKNQLQWRTTGGSGQGNKNKCPTQLRTNTKSS
jgi:hypothetical protein